MRLHHLSLTGFGPFAGQEEIDFDELSQAGLFLLTGPTGAGKTTILDGVCFALYGWVPGVRGVKALKSQHAPADRRPEVALEFSVRGRRFLLRRTPEWSRPKRRGDGFTTENATASLAERTSGEDHLLSSRAQEVGHFVGELIGMRATQFVQVAMLPQGEFQKFLRASSQERHDVLQHLFRTDRYARIEEWVHEHSRGLAKRSAQLQQGVVRALDTVADRVGDEVPDALGGDGLRAREARVQATAWVVKHLESAEAAHAATRDRHAGAQSAYDAARAAHETAVAQHALHTRRAHARKSLAELAADASVAQAARSTLDRDSRAAHCLPLARMVDEAVAHRDALAADWQRAAPTLLAPEDSEDSEDDPTRQAAADRLAELEQQARDRLTRLEALLPRQEQLVEARHRAEQTERELERLAAEQRDAQARAAEIPAEIERARAQASAAAATAGRAEAWQLELDQARRRARAAADAERLADSMPAVQDAAREARDRAADARDRVQELTARRLAGIAAELAGQLADGHPCQVCGSTDHPAPAAPAAEPVTDREQDQAAAAHEQASAAQTEAESEVVQLRERLHGLLELSSGLSPTEASEEVDRLAAELAEAKRARAELAESDDRLGRLTAERDDLDGAVHELQLRAATLAESLEGLRSTVRTVSAELAEFLDEDDSVPQALERQAGLVRRLAEGRRIRGALDDAEERVTELSTAAASTAAEHGFDSLPAARSAVLDTEERDRLGALLEARSRAEARARAVLEEDEILALGEDPAPDVAARARAAGEAETAAAACARELHSQEETVAALRRGRTRLHQALEAWEPVLDDFVRADSMARLVRGMGGDNQLQMRLSAYVLARRLDQVVAAANERLGHMNDQRYLLQRTGRAARKGTQAGLGLEVVDQWTGDVRDPATLSGGETFVVSLSLALGLADVVTQEAGGTEIETLFVDEGFGTLDADTLEDVMDRLDELRAGGRAVGVVSHVSELRNRIPTQLHIDKHRHGSTVAVRTTVG